MLYSKKDYEFEMSYVKGLIDGIQEKTVRDRISNLLVWYVKGSYLHRGRYLAAMIFAYACNAAVPVLVLLQGVNVFSIAVAIISAVSGVTMALNSMYKWHDSWLRSRRNAEIIKNRTVLFVHGYDPYDQGTASMEQFVQDIERMVMEEGDKWFAVRSKHTENNSAQM